MVLGSTPEARELHLRLSCELLERCAMAVPCSSTALLHSPAEGEGFTSYHPALTSAVPARSGAAVRVHPMLPNKRLPTLSRP